MLGKSFCLIVILLPLNIGGVRPFSRKRGLAILLSPTILVINFPSELGGDYSLFAEGFRSVLIQESMGFPLAYFSMFVWVQAFFDSCQSVFCSPSWFEGR